MLNRITVLFVIALAATVFIMIKTVETPRATPAVPEEWHFVPGSICFIQMTAFRQTQDRVAVRLDRISFGNHADPANSAFSKFGLANDFFADFLTGFSLSGNQEITFTIYSDDGFSLYIDGEEKAGFPADRAYDGTRVTVALEPGEHRLELRYFQAGGHIGLDAYYSVGRNGDPHFIGEDCDDLTFIDARDN